MKKRLLLLCLLLACVANVLLAEPPSYIQTKDGVIVFTDPVFTGTSNAVKLEVVSDNIIRVTAAPFKKNVSTESLVVVHNKRSDIVWNIVPSKDKLTLKTKTLTAIINLKTGVVSFWDSNGKKIIGEKTI